MARYAQRLGLLTLVSLAALLTVGVTTASAHGGRGNGATKANTSALVTQAAKELGVARADLKTAIVDSAKARIDEAVAGEDIDADRADELKEEADDNLSFAYTISRTKTVATNLKITTAKLNEGFRAARKALAIKKIDNALANGDITEEEAADLKAELEDVDLPGYKTSAFAGFGEYGSGGCGGGTSSQDSGSGFGYRSSNR
jgi:hypothetical protein